MTSYANHQSAQKSKPVFQSHLCIFFLLIDRHVLPYQPYSLHAFHIQKASDRKRCFFFIFSRCMHKSVKLLNDSYFDMFSGIIIYLCAAFDLSFINLFSVCGFFIVKIAMNLRLKSSIYLFGGRTFTTAVFGNYFRLPDFSQSGKFIGHLYIHTTGIFSCQT